MEKEKIYIDPEKFALRFISSFNFEFNPKELEVMAKKELAAYLSAYFLVEKFNKIEGENFDRTQPNNLSDLGFDDLLAHVTDLNKY
ncbi:hypothetical protein [Leuconostoc miyukkimchii]|uniref:hypothetical protein n=1 Tax=Leuconostoc miyukkimchii TaxID=910540 RepID=UPI001C7D0361|nr:hypothetical protein [Leuconostoc miyukkimchii]